MVVKTIHLIIAMHKLFVHNSRIGAQVSSRNDDKKNKGNCSKTEITQRKDRHNAALKNLRTVSKRLVKRQEELFYLQFAQADYKGLHCTFRF